MGLGRYRGLAVQMLAVSPDPKLAIAPNKQWEHDSPLLGCKRSYYWRNIQTHLARSENIKPLPYDVLFSRTEKLRVLALTKGL